MAPRRHLPPQPGDLPDTEADLTRLRARTGYTPQVTFDLGLKSYCAWLKTSDD